MYFVENLTIDSWLISVLPRLMWRRLVSRDKSRECYVIDGSGCAKTVAKMTAWMSGVKIQDLEFHLVGVRDEEGLQARLRVQYLDQAALHLEISSSSFFKDLADTPGLPAGLPKYLAQNIAGSLGAGRGSIWRALYVTHVCAWKLRQNGPSDRPGLIFMPRRPWQYAVNNHAAGLNMSIVPVRREFDPRSVPALRSLSRIANRLRRPGTWFTKSSPIPKVATTSTNGAASSSGGQTGAIGTNGASMPPMLAVEYHGQLELDSPERHSDLFFWQQSELQGEQIILTAGVASAPLDAQRWGDLKSHGFSAVAQHASAATEPDIPVLPAASVPINAPIFQSTAWGPKGESAWLKKQMVEYGRNANYWTELFGRFNAKIFVTRAPTAPSNFALADSLHALGGASTIYQWTHASVPSNMFNILCDAFFCYSKAAADLYRTSGSDFKYGVITGYLGDHRFPLLKESAKELRRGLEENGAERVVSYFDDNTSADSRWLVEHQWERDNYEFLLEKTLADPTLGLLIKPKDPNTLRRRLGPVTELLEKAEATGRCYVYEGGLVRASRPPAEAAMAADLAIHGRLYTGSAGVDAAMAGVPTIMLDREGWAVSPFYKMGVGKVVFTDWDSLWEACTDHWSTPGGVPGLGDWGEMLHEIDPFRDGRAAERMGTYLKWLIEGFREGQSRETVLADAAERYSSAWGHDKIAEAA